MKSDGLVCIKEFAQIDEAEIAKNLLIANGIKASVFTAGSAYPHVTFTTGARLMVDEKDKETALRLLDK